MGNDLTTTLRVQLHRFRDLHSLVPLLRAPRPWQVRVLPETDALPITLESDGLRLAGSYYPARDDAGTHRHDQGHGSAGPGIVLAHGSSPHGRRLPLIQVLAVLLRQRGYHVLTYDARCYGESDHPPTPDDIRGFDFGRDVSAALDWLAARSEVDAGRMSVIGHSFGAGAALAAEVNDTRIARLVLFGPPRRLRERFLNEHAPHRQLILSRMQRDMNVPYPLNEAVICRMIARRDIEGQIEHFQGEDHAPLLLLDAAREGVADRDFLRHVHRRMGPHVTYWTVPDTDHYLNTGRLLGRVVYHPARVLPFVEKVDRFLCDPSPVASASASG